MSLSLEDTHQQERYNNNNKDETIISMPMEALRQFLDEYRAEIVKECKREMVSLLSSGGDKFRGGQDQVKQEVKEEASTRAEVAAAALSPSPPSPPLPIGAIETASTLSSSTSNPSRAGGPQDRTASATATATATTTVPESSLSERSRQPSVYFDAHAFADENEDLDSHITLEEAPQSSNVRSGNNNNSGGVSGSGIDGGRSVSPRSFSSFLIRHRGLTGLQNTTIRNQEYWLLEHDTFSILFVSHYASASFLFAIAVTAVQFFTLSLICWDLFYDPKRKQGERDDDVFNLPVFVNSQVSWAQCLALIVAVVSQDDMRNSIVLLVNGYREDQLLEHGFPGATKVKWIFSNLLRLLEGIFVVFVSFLFIIQADTVLDIFLNFAAVVFVSELDNLAFVLARNGYLSNAIMDQAKRIQRVRILKRTEYIWLQRVLILIPFLPLFFFWSMHFHYQRTGQTLKWKACRVVHVQWAPQIYRLPPNVQFEKEISTDIVSSYQLVGTKRIISPNFQVEAPPALDYSLFSGYYHVDFPQTLVNRRPVYRERGSRDPTAGLIYYCLEERAWVFTIPAFLKDVTLATSGNAIPPTTTYLCGMGKRGNAKERMGYLWLSPVTDAFTLEDVPTSGWTAWTGSLQPVPPSDLSIACMDCFRNSDCGLANGVCQESSRRCDCTAPFGGPKCDVLPHCQEIHLFLPGECPLPFWAIPKLYVQNRPVYVVDTSWSTTPFVLVDVGRRWYLLEIPVSLQPFLFDGNNAARVVDMYEAAGGDGRIASFQNTWWNETGTTATHGYWNAMTPPEVVWAFTDMTDSYEPYGVGSDGLTWNAGKRGQVAGRSFQQMSLVCQDVNRLKTCSSDIVCGTFQVCTSPNNNNNNSSYGKCACPEGTFGEFCDNSIGACDGGR